MVRPSLTEVGGAIGRAAAEPVSAKAAMLAHAALSNRGGRLIVVRLVVVSTHIACLLREHSSATLARNVVRES